jgi:hypothetical protein
MLPDTSHDRLGHSDPEAPASSEQLARQQAIRQIQRRRRFWTRAMIATLIMIIVTASWTFTQYRSAGGWPTRGFTQSSWPLISNVWNDWIIWPAMVWVLWIAGDTWWTFGRKPISESEIQREIDRQAGRPR